MYVPWHYNPSLLTSKGIVTHREGWRTAVRRVKNLASSTFSLCPDICFTIVRSSQNCGFAPFIPRNTRPFILSTPPSHPQYSSPSFLGIVPYIPVLIPHFFPYSFLVFQHSFPISQSMSLHCKCLKYRVAIPKVKGHRKRFFIFNDRTPYRILIYFNSLSHCVSRKNAYICHRNRCYSSLEGKRPL